VHPDPARAGPSFNDTMTLLPPPAGITDKRRHVRKATLQSAQIVLGEGAGLASEIRDYCQTGLYVAFPGDRTPDAAMLALVGTLVKVGFSVGQGAAARSYLLNGWVARVAPGGVGVFIPAMPEAALQALREASARQTLPNAAANVPHLSTQQAHALQQECNSLYRNFLDAVMQEFFLQGMERLAHAGQDEPSFLERSRYEYGAQELMQRRSRIEEDFFNTVRERIQHVGPLAETAQESSGRNSLSLVEEAEFEDWLNLSAVIKQIESDIAPQLNEFEQRYSRLVDRPVDRKNNPYGPETIGRTFQDAIQGLDFTNPMRTVLYKALGRAVSSHAPALYRQLNQVLATLQPLAPVREKARPQPAAIPAAADEGAAPKPDLADVAETLNQLYRADQATLTPTPENTEYSLDRILATLDRSQREPAAASAAAQGSGPQPGAGAAAPEDLLQMVDRLQQARRQLAVHETPLQPPPGAPAGAALPEASLQELLGVLESLPLTHPTAAAGGAIPGTLTEQIDARIVSANGEAKRLAPDHRQILDTLAELFSRARADFVPSSEVESLIKRLERPLLKLALRDTRFPATPDHPARQVLNLIEQFAVAADDKGKFFDAKLQRFLYLLVDRVCSRADEDPGVYDMVRDSLEKVLVPILKTRRARVARMQEASEGRERIRVARARVNEALEARLAGRQVPGMLLRLLDAGWRQYLVLLEMREGVQSSAWEAALAVLDRVSASLVPTGASPRSEVVPGLLGEIERALSTVTVDAELLAGFMKQLADRLADSARAEETVFVPPGRLAAQRGDSVAHTRLIDRLRRGDWWALSLDGSPVTMQLIWISQPPFSCTFANRSATRKLDFTFDELMRQIHNQSAKPGRDLDLPLLDRSEHALFDDSYRELAQQALHDPFTGLLNRKGFMQRLQVHAEPESADKTHVLGIIEFDQFRLIRNACGEQAIESLARSLSSKVRTLIGPLALLAAFRDDTLALLLPDCSRADGCPTVRTLLGEMKDFLFQHGAHSYRIGFNIGLSEFNPVHFTAAEAVRRADSACLTAKSLGRNQIQVYEQDTPQLQSVESLMDWAGRIDTYLQGDGLYLRCQQVRPLGAAASRKPYYEILLGIDDGTGQAISPLAFLPVVEHVKRSHELDIWVISKAFAWIRANLRVFDTVSGFAINLSASSLSNREVSDHITTLLAEAGFPADRITFEITESAAIESYGAAQEFIRVISRHGCKFALDDFGSGFTSYAHLKNLRTDTLKIDGSFVKEMLENPADLAMVKSMNDIAHSLGMQTVAEYVESPELLEALRILGVDYVQGYAVHRPCRLDELPF